MYEYEKMIIIFIKKISEIYESQTKSFKFSFDNFTDQDGLELQNFFKKNLYKISIRKRKELVSKYKKYVEFTLKDDLFEIFDLFQLSNKQIKDVVKKEESSIKGDFILEIKNIDDESIQEILQDELFEKLEQCNAFCKLIRIQDNYITYTKTLITTFNRELSTYTKMICGDDKINIKNLNLELSKFNDEAKNIIDFITEFHERRNIVEHHNQIITEEYLKKTNSDLPSKYVGSYLGTSPNYIKESYQMTVNYALLLTRHLATKYNENFNIKYVYNNLKDSKESIYDKLAKFVL